MLNVIGGCDYEYERWRFNPLRKLAHEIYRDFSAEKMKISSAKILIFLIFLLKSKIVGTC